MDSIPEFKKDSQVENKEKLSLRVLLAEDNEVLRNIVKEILEEKGYEVVGVADGQQLLDKLLDEKENWDLVISDNTMPEKTGLEAIREMRSNERTKNIPVIVMTGDVLNGLEKAFKELDVIYIEKPFQNEDLLKAVDRAINQTETLK
jgi:CheY-like chemotaxis protein